MDKQAACTGHNIACIRHKTHTIPSVHSVYFSDLIAGVIGHMQAVEAHQVGLGQSPAPLTVSTREVQSQELPPKKDDEEPVTTEMHGIPAIPFKAIKRILEGDYVDMVELLSNTWRLEEFMLQYQESLQCPANTKPHGKPVTNILTWVECFSSMAIIITSKYPSKAPKLWAYQRTIVRVSQNFEGPSQGSLRHAVLS